MAQLENTNVLEQRLKNLSCSTEKKELIDIIIEYHKKPFKARYYGSIVYRCNLHYLEDNINKPTIINEIKTYIDSFKN